MRVLVCGGRDYGDRAALFAALGAIHRETPIARIIHGGADGADMLAGEWATLRGVPQRFYWADWAKHGRKAGPIRNQEMLDLESPNLVLAAPGGRGTADMVRRARRAGVRVIEVPDRQKEG